MKQTKGWIQIFCMLTACVLVTACERPSAAPKAVASAAPEAPFQITQVSIGAVDQRTRPPPLTVNAPVPVQIKTSGQPTKNSVLHVRFIALGNGQVVAIKDLPLAAPDTNTSTIDFIMAAPTVPGRYLLEIKQDAKLVKRMNIDILPAGHDLAK